MQENRWSVPIEAWDEVDIEALQLIHKQATEYFLSINKVSSNITNRSYTFLAIIISFISIFSSLVFGGDLKIHEHEWYYYLWLMPLLASFILLLINILPYKIMHDGYIPKNVKYNQFFSLSPTSLANRALIMDQIEDTQVKIETTSKSNFRRIILLLLAIFYASAAILYLLFTVLI